MKTTFPSPVRQSYFNRRWGVLCLFLRSEYAQTAHASWSKKLLQPHFPKLLFFCLSASSEDHTTGHALPTLGGHICLFCLETLRVRLLQHLPQQAPSTALSDWAGTGNKIRVLGWKTNSLTLEGEEQTSGLLCQPKINNVLTPLPEETHRVSKCFSHSVRACKVLEEAEEKKENSPGSASLTKPCSAHSGRWVQHN